MIIKTKKNGHRSYEFDHFTSNPEWHKCKFSKSLGKRKFGLKQCWLGYEKPYKKERKKKVKLWNYTDKHKMKIDYINLIILPQIPNEKNAIFQNAQLKGNLAQFDKK